MEARLELNAEMDGENTRSSVEVMGKTSDIVNILCVIYQEVPSLFEIIKMSITAYNEVLDNEDCNFGSKN